MALLNLYQYASASAQSSPANTIASHFIIRSPSIREIELLAHTVDMRITTDIGAATPEQLRPEQVVLVVETSYRLQNVGNDGRTLRLTISPSPAPPEATAGATASAQTLAQNLNVQIDNQPAGLQAASDGTSTFELALAGDQTRTVLFTYSLTLGNDSLPTIVYPVQWLNSWANDTSLRINVSPAENIPEESWTVVAPESWNYALSNNIQQPDMKWLYDAVTPESSIQLQFVHPALWQGLQEMITTATSTPAAVHYLEIGSQYSHLYSAAISMPLSDQERLTTSMTSVAELFYAQAVAAYTQGIQIAEDMGDSSSVIALLHARLAGLYRNRIVSAGSTVNSTAGPSEVQYAALTVDESEIALNLLPAESTLRPELLQWQSEGLYSLLQSTQQQQKWDQSLDYLERLLTLTESSANPLISRQRLDNMRQILIIQEALDLLETGNKEGAISLAGADIANAALLPPIEEQSIFSQWEVTTTVSIDKTMLFITAMTDGQQLQRAQNGLSGLIGAWQRSGWTTTEREIVVEALSTNATAANGGEATAATSTTQAGSSTYALKAGISWENTQPVEPLLQMLPDDANWALLREILRRLTPQVEQGSSLLMEEQSLAMTLDLRAAGDHWNTMAAKLQRDAQQAKNEPTANTGDSSSANSPFASSSFSSAEAANAALTARIRSVNFANEAKVWQDLVERSWVIVRMTTNSSSEAASSPNTVERSWVATVTTPPQSFQLEASSLAAGRIAILIVIIILALFVLSGILWWLL